MLLTALVTVLEDEDVVGGGGGVGFPVVVAVVVPVVVPIFFIHTPETKWYPGGQFPPGSCFTTIGRFDCVDGVGVGVGVGVGGSCDFCDCVDGVGVGVGVGGLSDRQVIDPLPG